MRSFYIIATSLVILGCVFSFFLIPNSKEVALMHLRDKRFQKAYDLYLKEADRQDFSITVIMPLTKLLLQKGDVDRAIDVMELFLEKHPNHLEALDFLGTLYQYGQRPDGYLLVLEKLKTLKPSAKILRALSDIYNFNERYEEQVNILKELITFDERENEDFEKLSYLLASLGRYEEAVIIAENLKNQEKSSLNPEFLELAISLMLDLGREKKAELWASEFLEKNPSSKVAIQIARMCLNKGHSKVGLRLISPFKPENKKLSSLFSLFVDLKLSLGSKEENYFYLRSLYEEKVLPRNSVEWLVRLSIEREDYTFLDQAIVSLDLTLLPEEVIELFSQRALSANNPQIIQYLEKNIPHHLLKQMPLVQLLIDLSKTSVNDTAPFISKRALSYEQSINLLQFLLYENRIEQALFFATNLPAKQLNAPLTIAVAEILITLKKNEEALLFINKMKGAFKDKKVEGYWAVLMAELGEEEALAQWMEKEPVIAENVLLDIYYSLINNQKYTTALKTAQRLFKNQETQANKLLVAESLFHLEKFEESIGYYQDLPLEMLIKSSYQTALVQAIEIDPRFKKELVIHLSKREKLAKTAEEKLEIFYLMMERAKDHKKAEKILWDIAYTASIDSKQVQAIFYLWGENPPSDGLKWIFKRALEEPQEKKWLEKLFYGTKADENTLFELITKAGSIEEELLFSMQQLAAFSSRPNLSLEISVYLLKQYPSDKNRYTAALSMLHAGYKEEAIKAFSKIPAQDLEGSPYLWALLDLAKKEPQYQTTLYNYLKKRLQIPNLSQEKKRECAYILLEQLKKRSEAKVIFQEIALNKPFKSQEMQMVLYLLGPRPSKKEMEWITQNVKNSKEERILWLTHLYNTQNFDEVIALCHNQTLSLQEYKLYLYSLGETKELDTLFKSFVKRLQTASLKETEELFPIAYYWDFGLERRYILLKEFYQSGYRKANIFYEMGNLAYSQNLDKEAKRSFEHFFQMVQKESQKITRKKEKQEFFKPLIHSFFIYGELLAREGKIKEAYQYYQKVAKQNKADVDMQYWAAFAHLKMGEKEAGIKILQSLVKTQPQNSNFKADLANVLMDEGRHQEASLILEQESIR